MPCSKTWRSDGTEAGTGVVRDAFRLMRRKPGVRMSPIVVVWRTGHALVALGFLAAIGYVWWCALTRRSGRLLRPAVAALVGEGVLVTCNRGDCPLGGVGNSDR